MHKKKTISIILLIGMALGGYFTYTFYRVFFKPNTAFENLDSYVFIGNDFSFQDLPTTYYLQLGRVGTLEAVALALAELGETHAEAPLLSALRVACEAHEDAEVRASSPEMPT